MIKHKREEFLSDSGHRALAISGLFCGCVALDALRYNPKMAEVMQGSRGILIPAALFAALSVFFLLRGILKAGKRKRRAMESKRNYLQNGVLSSGKITDVGGGYYQQGHYKMHSVKPRHFHIWESRWWAKRHCFITLGTQSMWILSEEKKKYAES